MPKLAFVTNNVGKFQEISLMLGVPLDQVSVHINEIQSLDNVEIVYHKAVAAYDRVQKPLIVDDTSLHVRAWNGFPGPFIKHIVAAGGMELFLTMMQGTLDRRADFSTTLGYYNGKNFYHVVGTAHGKIADKVRGGKSWGVNAIFIPDEGTKTYAEMSLKQKNTVSHRAKATFALKKLLQEKTDIYLGI